MLECLWFPVARESDADGAPFATSLLGRRLVLFRTEQGVSAARDRCPHRGARLSLGQMRDGELGGPYHGWRFNRDGVGMLGPSPPGAHPLAALGTRPAQTAHGLGWACLG